MNKTIDCSLGLCTFEKAKYLTLQLTAKSCCAAAVFTRAMSASIILENCIVSSYFLALFLKIPSIFHNCSMKVHADVIGPTFSLFNNNLFLFSAKKIHAKNRAQTEGVRTKKKDP